MSTETRETQGAATFLDALVERIREAGSFNRNDQAAPAAVVWTDHDRQWEALLPRLRERLPLLTLGPYVPDERSGPAYWVRCMVAGALPEDLLPVGETPILYMPGVSRQELRAVEECPRALQPLAELQYRGVLWTQKNGRDWSIGAFLQSSDGGLGIEAGADSATREALQRALLRLAGEPLSRLRHEAPLRAPFFDALLNPDQPRRLLLWLNDPKGYRAAASDVEWASFREVCRRSYGFDPQTDGELSAAERLGRREGAWETVWQRFEESPRSYPSLPSLLERARPPQLRLFETRASWPQDNQTEEERLRDGLRELARQVPEAARASVRELESQHGARRAWVWSRLAQTPLANALEHLVSLATQTSRPLSGSSIHAIGAAYAAWGWQADAAVLDVLACVERPEDLAAVSVAIAALYRHWLEDAANALQQAVAGAGQEGGYLTAALEPPRRGTCLLFSDGLRYDLGRRLATALEQEGLTCEVDWHLTALPSVTATAKPAISPVASQFHAGQGLSAASASGAAVSIDALRRQLEQAGYQVLRGDETGDPAGRAWTELGDIDAYGHEQVGQLAHHLAAEIRSLSRRIVALLDAGWERVIAVTDHGWLLLPDGLPKAELPEHLTEIRKGRCARLKDAAATAQQTVPWYWNADVRIAVAPGICCYEAGKQYEHGGLSPQECVVPVISVSRYPSAAGGSAVIESVAWRGLRCTLRVTGAAPGMRVDLRLKAADPATSISGGPQPLAENGVASLLVADDDRLGGAAIVVVLSRDGTLLTQAFTTAGG